MILGEAGGDPGGEGVGDLLGGVAVGGVGVLLASLFASRNLGSEMSFRTEVYGRSVFPRSMRPCALSPLNFSAFN